MDAVRTLPIDRRWTAGEASRSWGVSPPTVSPDAAVAEIARLLSDRSDAGIVCVVGDDGRLEGVLTLTDLYPPLFGASLPPDFFERHMAPERIEALARASAATARDLLSPPVFVTADDTLPRALHILLENRFKGLPVVDADRKLVGLLSVRSLIREIR